ncbi:MAG: hypothetical protein M3Y21_12325 [Candidatus Eremiobacteraeota bacterium]|nr:hypothetical protein [Candidatus Eremiobacteraeota bacterium]
MFQPKGDPFFEQLKADIIEGLEEARLGKTTPLEEVRAHFHKRSKEGELKRDDHSR